MEEDKVDAIYRMIFRDEKGCLIDIRDAKILYFFRKDWSFASDIKRVIKRTILDGGSFEFKELKKEEDKSTPWSCSHCTGVNNLSLHTCTWCGEKRKV